MLKIIKKDGYMAGTFFPVASSGASLHIGMDSSSKMETMDFFERHESATLIPDHGEFSPGASSEVFAFEIDACRSETPLMRSVLSYYGDVSSTISLVVKSYSEDEEQREVGDSGDVKIFKMSDHPNIVKIFGLIIQKRDGSRKVVTNPNDPEMNEDDLVMGVIMEKADGDLYHSLADRLKGEHREAPFETAEIRDFLFQTGTALHHLYENDIRFADVKPQNILLFRTPDGKTVYKLTDFEAIKPASRGEIAFLEEGTELYEAPEIVAHKQHYPSSDIWPLGQVAALMAFNKRSVSRMSPREGYDLFVRKASPVKEALRADRVWEYRTTPLHFYHDRKYRELSPDTVDSVRADSDEEREAFRRFLENACYPDPNLRMTYDEFFAHEFMTGDYLRRDHSAFVEEFEVAKHVADDVFASPALQALMKKPAAKVAMKESAAEVAEPSDSDETSSLEGSDDSGDEDVEFDGGFSWGAPGSDDESDVGFSWAAPDSGDKDDECAFDFNEI
jgi:serine/threonine protein kinase